MSGFLEIENVPFVVEQEIQAGCSKVDVAATYALGLRKSARTPGSVPWARVNELITAKWGAKGLRWVKSRAWDYVEGRKEFGS